MAQHFYVSTAQKPTAVTHALTCRFVYFTFLLFFSRRISTTCRFDDGHNHPSAWRLITPHSLAGSSSGRNAPLHLVVVKGTRLEVHLVNQIASADDYGDGGGGGGGGGGDDDDDDARAGLSLVCEAPLFGTVAVLQKFRPAGAQHDRLFVVTVKKKEQKKQRAYPLADPGDCRKPLRTHALSTLYTPSFPTPLLAHPS